MISNKVKKLIGCSLIGISFLWFIPYFAMAIRATFPNPTISLDLSIYATNLFFIGFWMFHWPAFVLIGVGIFYLRKSKRLKTKINQNNNS